MENFLIPTKGKNILCVPLILLLIVSIAAMVTPNVEATVYVTPPPLMWVEPPESVATALPHTFTVTVTVDDIPQPGTPGTQNGGSITTEGCSGIEIKLSYDPTLLDVLSFDIDPASWLAGFTQTPIETSLGDTDPTGEAGWIGLGYAIIVIKPTPGTYAWTATPQPFATITFNVTQAVAYPGTLECPLHLYDVIIYEASTVDSFDVTITDGVYKFIPPIPAPKAAFSWTPPSPVEGEEVTFDASASTPDGGYITLYSWDFGDETELNITDPTTAHTYTTADTYNVTLTVYDSDLDEFGKNLTDTTWKLVEVFPPLRPLVCVSPNLVTAGVGKNVTININVINVTNLWGFEIGLSYDTTLLDGLEVLEGPFLKTGGTTLIAMQEINDAKGYVRIEVALYGAEKGVDGNGTLATITFKVKASGYSLLHLYNPYDYPFLLLTEVDTGIVDYLEHDTEDGYFGWSQVVDLGALGSFPVIMASNSTVSEFAFSLEDKEVTFNVAGTEGTTGFCKVAIPKNLLRANATHPWKVLLNDMDITAQTTITEDDTHTFIYFTYTHTTASQEVTNRGTWVVPEFSTALIVPLLMIATLAAAILGKWSKKRRSPIVTRKQPA